MMDRISSLPPELREMIYRYHIIERSSHKRELNNIFKSAHIIWVTPFADVVCNNEYIVLMGPCPFCLTEDPRKILIRGVRGGIPSKPKGLYMMITERRHCLKCRHEILRR